ncbi:MAG: hypothetical protein IH969_01205, partial [Candidatus Krumholzibacteriota bacterium]|nr:hypothetical protein [Candidatus Krumholzibacteriota bacterium]
MMRMILVAVILAGGLGVSRAHAGEAYSLRWLPESVERAGTGTPAGLAALEEIDASEAGDISPGRAALYSLLLPGLGDYKVGNRSRSYVFFGIEAALWTALVVSRVQGEQREDTYQEYAVLFAGVDRTGHSDEYYALLRKYDNSDQYEMEIKQEGREELYPEFDPNGQDPDVGYSQLERYFNANRVADYEEWEWRSLENKIQFQETRSASKNAYQRSNYALAALAANRVVSAIFAYTSVRRSHAAADELSRRFRIDFTLPRSDYEAS